MSTRLTRAQTLTGSTKKTEFFSDFLNSFAKTPVGDSLARVTNDRSINQSLKNIILTNLGERLFNPNFGSNIIATLFENSTENVLSALNFYIRNSIEINEPRVYLIDVILENNEEANELIINIIYKTLITNETATFTYILKRVR